MVHGITATAVVLLLGVRSLTAHTAFTTSSPSQQLLMGVISVACAAILVASWAYAPRGYSVESGVLRIERPAGAVEIPLASVRSVREYGASLSGSVRKLGNGGMFGIYGRYHRSDLGDYRMYGSRIGNAVVLDVDGGTVVVTPRRSAGLRRGAQPADQGPVAALVAAGPS